MKRVLILTLASLAAACSDRPVTAPAVEIDRSAPAAFSEACSGVWGQISPESPTILVGGSVSMNATFNCQHYDGSIESVVNPWGTSWYRDNAAVSLSSNGYGGVIATGQNAGQTYVDAVYAGILARALVTVKAVPVVFSIVVSPSSWSALIGDNAYLSATAYDQYGQAMSGVTFTWSSSNTSIATVSSTGQVHGVAAGNAIVTASAGGRQGTSTGTVRTPNPSVRVIGWEDVRPGSGCVLRYKAEVTDATPNSYAWETSGTVVSDYGNEIDVYFTQYGANYVKVTAQTNRGALDYNMDWIQVSNSGMECSGGPPYGY